MRTCDLDAIKLSVIGFGKQKVGRAYDFDEQEPSPSSLSIDFLMVFRQSFHS